MTYSHQQKIRRLLALALDSRGSEEEADAAAVKAFQLARAHGMQIEEIALAIGFKPEPKPEPGMVFDGVDSIQTAIHSALHRAASDFLAGLRPPRTRRAAR